MLFYHVADLVSRLHVASCKNIYTVNVSFTKINLRLLILFNMEGFIEGFRIFDLFILVFLRKSYLNIFMLFKHIKNLSTPGRRLYWGLRKLLLKYSYSNFSGCFIISSSKGIITSSDSLLKLHTSGEVILKIFV
jgi:ribosomal protein S8